MRWKVSREPGRETLAVFPRTRSFAQRPFAVPRGEGMKYEGGVEVLDDSSLGRGYTRPRVHILIRKEDILVRRGRNLEKKQREGGAFAPYQRA